MQIDLSDAIFYSKLIIKNGDYYSGIRFREFSEGFFGTTEYINYYLENERFKKNKALTVLASGDHVFNLAFNGVKEIDAFDINKLQYFVYHLRRAMIESLNYEEYIIGNANFSSIHLDEVEEMLEKVKKHLSEEVYEYYRKIFEFARKCGRLENLYNGFYTVNKNAYLASENDYLALREKLRETKITLYFKDAREISGDLSGGYDIILLSNISDYLGKKKRPLALDEFKKFIMSFYSLLNDDGIIINYLYDIYERYIIKNSIITKDDLGYDNVKRVLSTNNQGYYRARKLK